MGVVEYRLSLNCGRLAGGVEGQEEAAGEIPTRPIVLMYFLPNGSESNGDKVQSQKSKRQRAPPALVRSHRHPCAMEPQMPPPRIDRTFSSPRSHLNIGLSCCRTRAASSCVGSDRRPGHSKGATGPYHHISIIAPACRQLRWRPTCLLTSPSYPEPPRR